MTTHSFTHASCDRIGREPAPLDRGRIGAHVRERVRTLRRIRGTTPREALARKVQALPSKMTRNVGRAPVRSPDVSSAGKSMGSGFRGRRTPSRPAGARASGQHQAVLGTRRRRWRFSRAAAGVRVGVGADAGGDAGPVPPGARARRAAAAPRAAAAVVRAGGWSSARRWCGRRRATCRRACTGGGCGQRARCARCEGTARRRHPRRAGRSRRRPRRSTVPGAGSPRWTPRSSRAARALRPRPRRGDAAPGLPALPHAPGPR